MMMMMTMMLHGQYSSVSSTLYEADMARRASTAVTGSLLDVPRERERNLSLPGSLEPSLHTVRLFSVQGGRLVSHCSTHCSTSPSGQSRSSSPWLLQVQEDRVELLKVLMLGAGGVGKSSLCAQFVSSDYVDTYHAVGGTGQQHKQHNILLSV